VSQLAPRHVCPSIVHTHQPCFLPGKWLRRRVQLRDILVSTWLYQTSTFGHLGFISASETISTLRVHNAHHLIVPSCMYAQGPDSHYRRRTFSPGSLISLAVVQISEVQDTHIVSLQMLWWSHLSTPSCYAPDNSGPKYKFGMASHVYLKLGRIHIVYRDPLVFTQPQCTRYSTRGLSSIHLL